MATLINIADYQDVNFWVNLGLIMVFLITVVVFLLRYFKRIFITIFYFVSTPVTILLFALGLFPAFYTALGIFIMSTILFFLPNVPEFRPLVGNPLKKIPNIFGFPLRNGKGPRHTKIYDRDAVFSEIETAVDILSKTKTGALITIERSSPLEDLIKNGTKIDAKVNSSLLLSIFYKGTMLHDGAVVIREDRIIAASVYYTPTTKGLMGKVGSRHRAALGISEITDSVTIIVSEETGRISIAYKGMLQSVTRDTFVRVLTDFMDMGLEEKEN